MGLGLSVKWGTGLLLTKRQAEQQRVAWSAPAFFNVQCASVGVSAGIARRLTLLCECQPALKAISTWDCFAGLSSVQTLLILGTTSAVDTFLSRTAGHGGLVLGQDVKIAAVSDLGWGATENGFGSVLDGANLSITLESQGLYEDRYIVAVLCRGAFASRNAGTLSRRFWNDAGLEPRRYAEQLMQSGRDIWLPAGSITSVMSHRGYR